MDVVVNMPHARIWYLVFYILFYSENLLMMLLWFFLKPKVKSWHPYALAAGLSALPVHVALMCVYYGVCHPMATDCEEGRGRGIREKKVRELLKRERWGRELWYVDRLWVDDGDTSLHYM
jgi:hypothetical protein